jgi:predicted transcriptional regulator
MAMSFRLDSQTEAHIRRLAKATGRSKSAVVRDAMAQYMAGQISEATFHQSTLERLRGFAGVISSEGQFSTDTHAKFQDALTRKYRGRGSR